MTEAKSAPKWVKKLIVFLPLALFGLSVGAGVEVDLLWVNPTPSLIEQVVAGACGFFGAVMIIILILMGMSMYWELIDEDQK